VSAHDAVAGDDLIGHAEVAAAMGDELVYFFEGARIEQQIDPFTRCELACLALAAQTLLAAAELGPPHQILQSVGIHE
jgi:hypothetical protein